MNPKIIIPSAEDVVRLIGQVQHFVDGELVYEQHNAINADLKTYFQNSMDTAVDNAINSLMDTAEVALGGAQDGNDGIAIHDSDVPEWITMVTTTMAANNTYGKRWQGQVASMSQARTIDESALGYNFAAANPVHFETIYATQSFTGIPLSAGANYIIEWEIYIP